jgi:glyoxylase-like metal-dependent hydrolase (beta-lactamase superfamily II)
MDARIMAPLPTFVRFVVRGWLNCNQVVLLDRDAGHVVVDSGYHAHSARTLALVADALGGEPLAHLVNTHCHSDHIGGNAAIAERFRCRTTIPRGEAASVDDWPRQERWNAYVDQEAVRFGYDATLAPGETFRAGGRDWVAHAAPGHDMEALMFFEPRDRILITGDALWSNGLGFVWPHEPGNPFVEAALETLDRIASLAPRVVLPGHGEAFEDVDAAIGRARSRLASFAHDPRRTARHMMKVMFVFALLARGSLAARAANEYVRRVPCYSDINARFVGADMATLGDVLAADLVAAGALRGDDEGRLVPTMAA